MTFFDGGVSSFVDSESAPVFGELCDVGTEKPQRVEKIFICRRFGRHIRQGVEPQLPESNACCVRRNSLTVDRFRLTGVAERT